MPDTPLPNNPYARPIHATRPEGQMLQGEYYGERAKDKSLAGHHGRQVSSASRFVGRAIAVPVDMDAPPAPKTTRKRKAATPSPDASSPSNEQPAVLTVPPDEQLEPNGQPLAITEDDLFG